MDFLNVVILPAVTTLVTGLAGWGLSVLVAWLNTKIKNEKVRDALENTRDIITAAVAETSQTFVDDLKKTGSFTDALKAEAHKKAFERVISQLTDEAKKLIETTTNDINGWIDAEIEKAVKDSKKEG